MHFQCTVLAFLLLIGGLGPAGAAEPLWSEDFSNGMERWWVEGGQRVWIEDGRLHVLADPPAGTKPGSVATIWCREPIAGDVRIRFDARVVSSSPDANNINLFLFYSDPEGTPLEKTAEQRADADYGHYHALNGNIVTFVNEPETPGGESRARVRLRRCPGFQLLAETRTYHCRPGHTYRFDVTRRGKVLTVAVDGQVLLTAEDPEPHRAGLLGLRTFRTHLWWDDIVVEPLPAAGAD